jgi:hypothetical protein
MLLLGGAAAAVGYAIYRQTRATAPAAAAVAPAPPVSSAAPASNVAPAGIKMGANAATALCPIKYMGEPSYEEEDNYVNDLVAAAHAAYNAFHPRFKEGVVQYLQEIAMKDPFWTPENIAKRDFVGEYQIFLAGLDHHKYEWENGTPGSLGRPTSMLDFFGHCETYADPYFVRQTIALEAAYWGSAKNAEAMGVFATTAPSVTIRKITSVK